MLRHRHWHMGHHQRGHRPCTPVRCFGDPAEAVRALGEAIGEWADTEYERPDDERDADAAYASAMAEIFTGARAPEFHDEVSRVRRGGTGYRLGDRLYWVIPAATERAPGADTGCGDDD